MIFDIPLFSYSLKVQQKALKKYYCVDTGLANAVSYKISEDKGRMLENIIFLELKRNYDEIYYYKEAAGEVDFVIKKKNGKKELIQVAWELEDKKTMEREAKGLKLAAKKIKAENEDIQVILISLNFAWKA